MLLPTLSNLATFSLVFFGALPVIKAEPVPQEITNNAPFSGAVYIVTSDGQQVTAQDGNWCPSSASQSCSNMNYPSWCCPANYACVAPGNSNGMLGCCPHGQSCNGAVNVAQVTTVTVYPQHQTAVVYANPPPVTTVYNNPPPNNAQGGFCATITMDGPGLPRAANGDCGTILLVAGAPGLKTFGIGAGLVAIMLHVALGRMFARN